jgi:6-phosphogluconolactonase
MRTFTNALRTSFLAALSFALCAPPCAMAKDKPGSQYFVYYGMYTGPKSKGVMVSRFDSGSGKLEAPRLAAEVVNPSWVTIHPNGRFLYAVSELGNDGSVSSFAIDASTGDLKFLNKVPSGGTSTCHLAIDKAGKAIYAANYGDGSVIGFDLAADGTIGQRKAFMKHSGSSTDPRRQKGPHAHAVVLSKDERFLIVPDLGLDQYITYKVASDKGLEANQPPYVKIKAGSGPRHFAFHPSSKFGYGVNEMGSSVTAFSYDGAKGTLTELETVSTLPSDFSGEDNSAEIEVDEAGKFVYASNRGHDSIAVFAIDLKTGKLTNVQRESTQGKIPRGFKIDPTGQYLLAGNQRSDNVVVFRIDDKTGKLTPTGQVVDVPAPVCFAFLPAKRAR